MNGKLEITDNTLQGVQKLEAPAGEEVAGSRSLGDHSVRLRQSQN